MPVAVTEVIAQELLRLTKISTSGFPKLATLSKQPKSLHDKLLVLIVNQSLTVQCADKQSRRPYVELIFPYVIVMRGLHRIPDSHVKSRPHFCSQMRASST